MVVRECLRNNKTENTTPTSLRLRTRRKKTANRRARYWTDVSH